jgi:membrane fusion protein, heavy metal efflux system
VPTESIVSYQGQDYIFILKEDQSLLKEHSADSSKTIDPSKEKELIFERVQVVKGTSDVGFTEVTLMKKLPPKTRIVSKGAFFVSAKMTNVGEEE